MKEFETKSNVKDGKFADIKLTGKQPNFNNFAEDRVVHSLIDNAATYTEQRTWQLKVKTVEPS